MKLLGRDVNGQKLVEALEDRLRARGLLPAPVEAAHDEEGVEPRVDPLGYNLAKLEEHADATRGLPLHTHRGGLGQAVVVAKWAFRKSCQVFINEALSRQRVFNGHVRDSYAQLSAEVVRLRAEVERLNTALAARPSAGALPRPHADRPEGQRSVAAPPRKPAAASAKKRRAPAGKTTRRPTR